MAKTLVTAMLHPERAKLLRGADVRPGASVSTFCGWQRLAELLRDAGQLSPNEEIETFVIEDGGLTIHLRNT